MTQSLLYYFWRSIFCVLLLSTFAASCDNEDEEDNEPDPNPPVASFTFSPTSPEEGQAVTFTNTSTDATSFEWSAAGTSFSSTDENPTFTFDAEGDYEVKLVATGEGGTDETTQTVSVSAAVVAPDPPVASFTFSPTSPEEGQEVSFTNTSTNATSYEWSAAGTSFSSTDENPTFTFDTEGSYEVKLVATGEGGTDETTRTVSVSAVVVTPDPPVASFTFSPTEPEAGQEVTFTNTSTNATSYEWSAAGTSFSSTDENPIFTFDAEGSYEVKLVATGAGGTDETTQTVTVKAAPTSGGGGTNDDCNLPICYISSVNTSSAAGNITITFEYVDINGQKRISVINTPSPAGTLRIEKQYDSNGREIRQDTRLGGTITGYIEYEYSNGGLTVRANSYGPTGALTGYTITTFETPSRRVRDDNYDANDNLTSYTVYSDFIDSQGYFDIQASTQAGSLPQLVETFDANNNLTQRDVHTYQDCMLIKTVSTDGSGTKIGEVNNTLNAQGFIGTSVAEVITAAGTFTSNSTLNYDCE